MPGYGSTDEIQDLREALASERLAKESLRRTAQEAAGQVAQLQTTVQGLRESHTILLRQATEAERRAKDALELYHKARETLARIRHADEKTEVEKRLEKVLATDAAVRLTPLHADVADLLVVIASVRRRIHTEQQAAAKARADLEALKSLGNNTLGDIMWMVKEHQEFRTSITGILGGCVGFLPAGENWAATDDGVLQYLRDIVGRLNHMAANWVERSNSEDASGSDQPWQPMSTAPKDGRDILLHTPIPGGSVTKCVVAHWMPGGHCIEDHPPIDAGWYYDKGTMFDKTPRPIAWAPLPPLPGGQEHDSV